MQGVNMAELVLEEIRGMEGTGGGGDGEEVIIDIVEFNPVKGGKRSWVWEHFGFVKKGGTSDKEKTICKICMEMGRVTLVPYTGNTSTMAYHLGVHHHEVARTSSGRPTKTSNAGGKANAGLARTLARKMSSGGLSKYNFESLAVTSPQEFIYKVEMNRPEKRNAVNKAFGREVVECFNTIATDQDCRVVLLTGAGKMFSAGINLQDNAELMQDAVPGSSELDVSRIAYQIRLKIKEYQESFFVIEKCPKPVIAAVHGGCVGGGLCMISGCDIRLCTDDAWFQIKETELGLAADVGVLQWLPQKTANDSLLRELCYTARRFDSKEAKELGLVSRLYPDQEAMMVGAMELAADIASKSPVAVQGTKVNLNYSRDHSVADSFEYAATWNAVHLQTEDLAKAVMAGRKRKSIATKESRSGVR